MRKYPMIKQGDRFGLWVALENEQPCNRYIKCKCNCGTIRNVIHDSLYRGTSKSCGSSPQKKVERNIFLS